VQSIKSTSYYVFYFGLMVMNNIDLQKNNKNAKKQSKINK